MSKKRSHKKKVPTGGACWRVVDVVEQFLVNGPDEIGRALRAHLTTKEVVRNAIRRLEEYDRLPEAAKLAEWYRVKFGRSATGKGMSPPRAGDLRHYHVQAERHQYGERYYVKLPVFSLGATPGDDVEATFGDGTISVRGPIARTAKLVAAKDEAVDE